MKKKKMTKYPIFYQNVLSTKSWYGVIFPTSTPIEARGKTKKEVRDKIEKKAKKVLNGKWRLTEYEP